MALRAFRGKSYKKFYGPFIILYLPKEKKIPAKLTDPFQFLGGVWQPIVNLLLFLHKLFNCRRLKIK